MRKLIRFAIVMFVVSVFAPINLFAVSLEVPLYSQHDFNDFVTGDCAPTAAGMLTAYWYTMGYSNLIPDPDQVVDSLDDWGINPRGIKEMVEDKFSVTMELNLGGGGTRDNEDVPKKINNGLVALDSNAHFLVSAKSFNSLNQGQIFGYIKSRIDNGLPVFMSTKPNLKYWSDPEKTGTPEIVPEVHALAVKGYIQGNNNVGNMLIVNMGFGHTVTNYIAMDDLGYLYSQDLWMNLYTITPSEGQNVGLYSDGWHYMYVKIDDPFDYINSPTYNTPSQPFVDTYVEAGGEAVFGLPWDNGGTEYVHAYPDANNADKVYIQDFLYEDEQSNYLWYLLVYNDTQRKVHSLTGQILDFWWENSGYNTYGPPTEAAHSETDVNNNAIIVQGFQSGQYIGYCETTQFVGEVFLENGEYTQSIATPQIDNIMSMTTVSSYVCSGVDAFAYLGSSPDTDQPVVSIVNPLNSSEMKNIIFLNSNARAKYFTILSDMNGNGFPEIHLTAYDVTNLGKMTEIRDSKTGAVIQ